MLKGWRLACAAPLLTLPLASELLDLCGGIVTNVVRLKGFSGENSNGAKPIVAHDGSVHSIKGNQFT